MQQGNHQARQFGAQRFGTTGRRLYRQHLRILYQRADPVCPVATGAGFADAVLHL